MKLSKKIYPYLLGGTLLAGAAGTFWLGSFKQEQQNNHTETRPAVGNVQQQEMVSSDAATKLIDGYHPILVPREQADLLKLKLQMLVGNTYFPVAASEQEKREAIIKDMRDGMDDLDALAANPEIFTRNPEEVAKLQVVLGEPRRKGLAEYIDVVSDEMLRTFNEGGQEKYYSLEGIPQTAGLLLRNGLREK